MKQQPPRHFHGAVAIATVALALSLGGCVHAPIARPQVAYTGDPVVDGKAELEVAPQKDRLLWNYRIAASAMRTGRHDEARIQLDAALPLAGGVSGEAAGGARARSLFGAESEKLFIGEPYERVMAFYYRAILYWEQGEPDNARACYRSGQLIDGAADSAEYQADYVLLDYLDGFASAKLGSDGTDALARAKRSARGELPDYDPGANVLIFAEYGIGPRKYPGGEFGEQLRFLTSNSRTQSARLTLEEGRTVPLPPWDDLNYQATTRGGRVMDHILGNKAVFKGTTDAVGDLAVVGAAVAASNIRRYDGSTSRGSENTALALGAVGLISKIASAATSTRADIRAWDNLPQRLSFAAIRLPPGTHRAQLEFLDVEGRVLAGLTRAVDLRVEAGRDTVVFLSEHKR